MKFNFRKIASVLASVVMIGSTIGIAAAANYPAPFIAGGAKDVAIVYGSNALTSDLAAAVDVSSNLQYWLASQTAEGSSVIDSSASGGDSYKLEKTSTKFQLGLGVLDVVSGSVTDSNLPVLLADGVYMDDDNDEFDYTQTVTLKNHTLAFFEDNDYKEDVPSVGIRIASGSQVLTYSLDFTENPLWADLETSDIFFAGKEYYVLDAVNNTSLTLLDSAQSANIVEGETATVTVGDKSYVVGINFVESGSVKLDVDGEITDKISATGTYKLSDGTYVGVKEVNFNSKDTGVSNVEFSLGKGKLKLTEDTDVELNDDTVNGLMVGLLSSTEYLTKISLNWTADDDLFIAEGSDISMPGFNVLKLSWGGMTFPKEEAIAIEPDGDSSFKLTNFPLKDSTETINLLYWNNTAFTYIGKDSTKRLVTNTTSLTFDADTDEQFVASWTDGKDAESYLMRATSFTTENSINKTSIQYRKDSIWTDAKKDAQDGDVVSLGNVDLTLGDIDKNAKTVVITNTAGQFNKLYSKEGLMIHLPYKVATGAATTSGAIVGSNMTNGTIQTFTLYASEEDKNGNKGQGLNVTFTLADDASDDTSVTAVGGSLGGTWTEVGATDVEENYVYSALATKISHDKSGNQYDATLTYHGEESYGNVYLTSPTTVITPGSSGSSGGSVSELGTVTVKDTEVSSVSAKNLIVIGGSCVNTAAAKILGSDVALCGAAFTEKAGVGANQALIKVVKNPYLAADTTKVAMLIAGYEADDTIKAAKYVTTEKPSTAEGAIKLATSSTVATVVTA